MSKPTILCVDDETDNVDAMERLFRKKFNVLKAYSGAEALEKLQSSPEPVRLIITDQRMPGMTGIEFLEQTLSAYPDTIRMLLTGYTDLESVIAAVNKGQIYRYLTKPWDPVDLTNTVDRAIERYEIGQELKRKNADLAAAYEELKSLDIAKSNFMILINHELKTPLTTLLNFTGLLNETKLDEEQRLFLDRIEKSGERLKTLIDDVLLIVKSETGQLRTDRRLVEIKDVVSQLPPNVVAISQQKNQTLTQNLAHEKVWADPVQMREVFTRMVHNAVKFGRESSEITIESRPENGKILFLVTNKGSVISEAVIDKIFKPFFLDENIMNHSTGVGLGLTICQALLQLHDSGLNIRNNPDGVTVSFALSTSGPS